MTCRRHERNALERRRSLLKCVNQILNCFCFADRRWWKADAKGPLDAQDKLGSAEAVDPEIALDPAGQGDIHKSGALRMQLAYQIAHNRYQVAPKLFRARITCIHGC